MSRLSVNTLDGTEPDTENIIFDTRYGESFQRDVQLVDDNDDGLDITDYGLVAKALCFTADLKDGDPPQIREIITQIDEDPVDLTITRTSSGNMTQENGWYNVTIPKHLFSQQADLNATENVPIIVIFIAIDDGTDTLITYWTHIVRKGI